MHPLDQDPATESGLGLKANDHWVRLKWHRLRQSLHDPLFSPHVLHEGFRIGASMELDLRVRRDGGFVVLHDADLRGETTGTGPITSMTRDDLKAFMFKGEDRPLLFSEDLAALLADAHPDALLQFDMKDDFDTIGAAGISHLASLFRSKSQSLIISGACLRLIGAIANRLPEIRRGIDPTDRLLAAFKTGGPQRVEVEALAEIRGATQPDTVYLAWQLLLRMQTEGLDLVALCHAEGMRVDAWTFTPKTAAIGLTADETAQLNALVALKPDQITTDEAVALSRLWHGLPA